MKDKIEIILNKFPEVKWDRMTVDEVILQVYGWLSRDDGRYDFVLLRFDLFNETVSLVTSSAQHSKEFGQRLGQREDSHKPCERVKDHFPNVNQAPKRNPFGCYV